MAAFSPGDRVFEPSTCRAGTVIAGTILGSRPATMVVRLDDGVLSPVKVCAWVVEPDVEVVETAPLASVLTEFITGWRRDRPMRGSGFRILDPSDVEPVPALAWLERETGLSRDDLRRAQRPDENPVTELVVADALVAAIGSPSMFHDGTLTVQPNPARSCCGGSDGSSSG